MQYQALLSLCSDHMSLFWLLFSESAVLATSLLGYDSNVAQSTQFAYYTSLCKMTTLVRTFPQHMFRANPSNCSSMELINRISPFSATVIACKGSNFQSFVKKRLTNSCRITGSPLSPLVLLSCSSMFTLFCSTYVKELKLLLISAIWFRNKDLRPALLLALKLLHRCRRVFCKLWFSKQQKPYSGAMSQGNRSWAPGVYVMYSINHTFLILKYTGSYTLPQ